MEEFKCADMYILICSRLMVPFLSMNKLKLEFSYVRACTQWTISHTDLWELLDPHPRLELHILYVQVLGVGRGAVGELHLHRHHVGVRAERLPAETVLHRQTLTRDPVKQLVALQRAGGSNGL